MVHFINYHISELLHQNTDEIVKSDGDVSSSIVTLQERQKMRRQISNSLTKEGWTREAVTFLEKSKDDSESLDEYFQNEMKILMHDHTLQNHKRHRRFVQLIDKI